MKKLLAILLSMLMLVMLLPFTLDTASAQEDDYSGTCGDNLTWTFDPDSGTLTIEGSGEMDDYCDCVRYEDEDEEVYEDVSPWKAYKSQIQVIVLPQGLTTIGSYAFANCTGLTSITIPSSVKSIASYTYVVDVEEEDEDIWYYDEEDNTYHPRISAGAFSGCTRLTSVVIENGIETLGGFDSCTGLTSITIPDSVKKIDAFAFQGCTGLTSITIPNSVTSIDERAFEKCTGLTSITIPSSVRLISSYIAYGYCWYDEETKFFYKSACAFSGCTGLTSVIIENGIETLGGFDGCTGLTSITIPDSVKKIDMYAFRGCTGLTSITIPDSVTSIGGYAFSDCTGLTSITIPTSVRFISSYISRTSGFDGGFRISYYSAGAFSGCTGLTSVIIENGIEKLGGFDGCTGLTSITIPDSVKRLDKYAFRGCTGLTSITIPDSVTSIGEWAFCKCTGLTEITIPSSVRLISSYISYGYDDYSPDDVDLYKSAGAFSGCTGLTSVVIENGIKTIGGFDGCTGLTSIKIPDSVEAIDAYAFEGCTNLTWLTIPNSVTSIREYAFDGCGALAHVYYVGIESQKEGISIEEDNSPLKNATWHYAPEITTQPTSKSVEIGETATFKVVASGKGLKYQWYYRTSSSGTWKASTADCGKKATYTLTVAERHNGYQYRCKVSNALGYVYTKTVTLKTGYVPTITTQPTSKSVAIGKTATFKVTASGTDLTYQWYYRTSSSGTWKASTADSGKTATYKVSATAKRNGYQYRCRIKNAFGHVYTKAVTLKTGNPPSITTQPTSKTAPVGRTATFRVTASGTGLKYQWYYRTSSSGNWKASTSTSGKTATYKVTVAAKHNGYQFRCRVKNVFGYVYTKTVTLKTGN